MGKIQFSVPGSAFGWLSEDKRLWSSCFWCRRWIHASSTFLGSSLVIATACCTSFISYQTIRMWHLEYDLIITKHIFLFSFLEQCVPRILTLLLLNRQWMQEVNCSKDGNQTMAVATKFRTQSHLILYVIATSHDSAHDVTDDHVYHRVLGISSISCH